VLQQAQCAQHALGVVQGARVGQDEPSAPVPQRKPAPQAAAIPAAEEWVAMAGAVHRSVRADHGPVGLIGQDLQQHRVRPAAIDGNTYALEAASGAAEAVGSGSTRP